MSSGMNVEQAKEYAKTMTYKQAVSNCFHARGIMYRKATTIKLRELAEIADRLVTCRECKYCVPYGGYQMCMRWEDYSCDVGLNDFCSYGERRE